MASLARYERHARLAAEMNELSPAAGEYFRTCAQSFEACVLFDRPPPPRPRM